MKKRLTVFSLVALAAVFTAMQGQEEKVFPFEYLEVRLENGLKAYLIKAGSPGQISYVTVVRSGSRDEYESGKSGYAHFFEHMMFRGTARYPDYNGITGEIGAIGNAATANDFTRYYLVASSDCLDRIIDLESDRFMNLEYTVPQFRTEAGAIRGELSQGRSSPHYYLEEKTADTAFDRHTYKHLIVGFERDVQRMSEGYADSISYYRRYYRPENCVLLVAGDFDFDRAEALIRKYYSKWKAGYRAPEIVPEPPQTSPRRATVEFPGRALPILNVKFKGPAWNAADRITVATEVLGNVAFGNNSALFRKLVLQDRKAQSLTEDFRPMRDPGLIGVTAMVNDPADLTAVESEIGRTVEKFRLELCDTQLLEDTKSAMKYGFLMSLETAQGVCFALEPVAAFTGSIEAIEDYFRTIASITPEDVRTAARRYLDENGRTTITLLPVGEAAR